MVIVTCEGYYVTVHTGITVNTLNATGISLLPVSTNGIFICLRYIRALTARIRSLAAVWGKTLLM